MTRQARNKAIEKNRIALLRLVACWLFIAKLFSSKRKGLLPCRLGGFVSDQLYKAELAHYYLRVAIHRRWDIGPKPVRNDAPLNLLMVIARLKALKRALIKLKEWQRRLSDKYQRETGSHFGDAVLNPLQSRPNHRGFITCALKCRAPPALYFCQTVQAAFHRSVVT